MLIVFDLLPTKGNTNACLRRSNVELYLHTEGYHCDAEELIGIFVPMHVVEEGEKRGRLPQTQVEARFFFLDLRLDVAWKSVSTFSAFYEHIIGCWMPLAARWWVGDMSTAAYSPAVTDPLLHSSPVDLLCKLISIVFSEWR